MHQNWFLFDRRFSARSSSFMPSLEHASDASRIMINQIHYWEWKTMVQQRVALWIFLFTTEQFPNPLPRQQVRRNDLHSPVSLLHKPSNRWETAVSVGSVFLPLLPLSVPSHSGCWSYFSYSLRFKHCTRSIHGRIPDTVPDGIPGGISGRIKKKIPGLSRRIPGKILGEISVRIPGNQGIDSGAIFNGIPEGILE